MNLFHATRTFILRCKQFQSICSVDFSDTLNIPYFILSPWYVRLPNTVLYFDENGTHMSNISQNSTLYKQMDYRLYILFLLPKFALKKDKRFHCIQIMIINLLIYDPYSGALADPVHLIEGKTKVMSGHCGAKKPPNVVWLDRLIIPPVTFMCGMT